MEQWKAIEGYEGYYEVSNAGRVRSLDRMVDVGGEMRQRYGKIKTLTRNADGYMQVSLSKDGRTIKKPVHRLVALAFVPGYFEGAEVDHIDCDRANNESRNLRWVTHSDNVRFSIESGSHVCNRDLTGSNNPNYGNHTLRDKYANDHELSLLKQSRKGASNGRATSVTITGHGINLTFQYIGECVRYLIDNGFTSATIDSVYGNIWKARRYGSAYLGFRFI